MKATLAKITAASCRYRISCSLLCILFSTKLSWAAEEATEKSVTDPVLDLTQTTPVVLTLFKVFGALMLVVGLMLVVAFWLRKMGLSRPGTRQGTLIEVVDTKMIAPKKYVAVIQVAGETLALGITDQQISMLTRLEENESLSADSLKPREKQPAFSSLLGSALKREKK